MKNLTLSDHQILAFDSWQEKVQWMVAHPEYAEIARVAIQRETPGEEYLLVQKCASPEAARLIEKERLKARKAYQRKCVLKMQAARIERIQELADRRALVKQFRELL